LNKKVNGKRKKSVQWRMETKEGEWKRTLESHGEENLRGHRKKEYGGSRSTCRKGGRVKVVQNGRKNVGPMIDEKERLCETTQNQFVKGVGERKGP